MQRAKQRETVAYIAPLLAQLVQIAERDNLPELAYFIAMAHHEAATIAARLASKEDEGDADA